MHIREAVTGPRWSGRFPFPCSSSGFSLWTANLKGRHPPGVDTTLAGRKGLRKPARPHCTRASEEADGSDLGGGWTRGVRSCRPPVRCTCLFEHSRFSGLSSSVGRLTCERVWLAVAPPATLTQGERKEAEKLWMLFTPVKFILALQSSDFHDAKVLKKESLSLKLSLIYTYLLQVNFRVK